MNEISFQGKTTLLFKPIDLDSLPKSVYRDLTIGNKYRLENWKKFSANANTNSLAVILRNEKDGVLKYVSTISNTEKILDEITAAIKHLQKSAKDNLTAWIIGGHSISKGESGANTVKTLNKVADTIEKNDNIDLSILAGSKEGVDNLFIHTLSNNMELTLDKNINTKNPLNEELEKHFDIVELSNVNLPN